MPPKAIDLYAGCGGLSLGLQNAGFELAIAVEKDAWAAETHAANHPNVELICSDIRDISDEYWHAQRGRIDLVAGGPPCQGFSVSGKRQFGVFLDQNSLVEEFVRVALIIQPRLILIENVQGFASAQLRPGVKAFDYVSKTLIRAGYDVRHAIIQAHEHGVPSLRSRFFLVASLGRLPKNPFPRVIQENPPLSVWEAIGDLPSIEAGEGSDGPLAYASLAQNKFQTEMRKRSRTVLNHRAMNHSPRLVDRFGNIPMGGSSFRIGRSKKGEETVTVYKSNNQRLCADKPSLCITANFQSNYIHPYANRNLTAREAARLMTFPDRFIFKGKRTQMSGSFLKKYGREHENYLSQYNQIGNSVPPRLAERIASVLRQILEGSFKEKVTQLELI